MRGTTTAAVAAAALALAGATAAADEKDERIERLEREQAELRRELDELKDQRFLGESQGAVRSALDDYLRYAPGGTYVGPGGIRRPGGNITLGGYFSTLYRSSEVADAHSEFVDMRLVPQIHADISEGIAFDSEIEFEHGGVGGPADGEIVIEYAELSFHLGDAFIFKAGTLLIPFGKFNLVHDDPLNELSSRPTVDRFIVPSAFDLPGIGAEGLVELSDDASLNYNVALTNGFTDMFSSTSGTRPARGNFEHDDNHGKTAFGRVGVVPAVDFLDFLEVGASGVWGTLGDEGGGQHDLRGYAFDATASYGPWEFKGEWAHLGVDRHGDVPPPIDLTTGALGPIHGMHGYYAQLLYRITDPWVKCLPFASESASVGLVLRRDDVDLNDRVHGASPQDDERAWSIGINYRPTAKTVVKLEYRKARSGASGGLGEDRDLFALEFATYF